MDIYDLFQNLKIDDIRNKLESAEAKNRYEGHIQYLEAWERIDQLVLLSQALSEILVEKIGISKREILEKMDDIDLRDGKRDGRYVSVAKDCPQCDSKINGKFKRCFFCGYKDLSEDEPVI